MPFIQRYNSYNVNNDIRHNNVVLSYATSKTTYKKLKLANKLWYNDDVSLYSYILYNGNIRYVLIKGKYLTHSKFYTNNYLKPKNYVAFMDVKYKSILYNTTKLKIPEIKFVFTTSLYRGMGYGKLIYSLVLNHEKYLMSGNMLHTDSFSNPTGSYYIWCKFLSSKYNVYNYNLKYSRLSKYTNNKQSHIRYIASYKKLPI